MAGIHYADVHYAELPSTRHNHNLSFFILYFSAADSLTFGTSGGLVTQVSCTLFLAGIPTLVLSKGSKMKIPPLLEQSDVTKSNSVQLQGCDNDFFFHYH